jgi:hypothetical protein
MEALAKPARFNRLRSVGPLSVIAAGYLALMASAFWAFTETSVPPLDPVEDEEKAHSEGLISRCRPEGSTESTAD